MRLFSLRSVAVSLALLPAVLLTGCAMGSFSTAADAPAQITPAGIQGNNFGGHAPIVGAKVFLLQASTSGYGTKSTSLLTSAAGGTDTTIVGSGGSPAYYVTTDAAGHFNITGDYTCTAGLPVYLYAYGGAPDSNPAMARRRWSRARGPRPPELRPSSLRWTRKSFM